MKVLCLLRIYELQAHSEEGHAEIEGHLMEKFCFHFYQNKKGGIQLPPVGSNGPAQFCYGLKASKSRKKLWFSQFFQRTKTLS